MSHGTGHKVPNGLDYKVTRFMDDQREVLKTKTYGEIADLLKEKFNFDFSIDMVGSRCRMLGIEVKFAKKENVTRNLNKIAEFARIISFLANRMKVFETLIYEPDKTSTEVFKNVMKPYEDIIAWSAKINAK
jgi:hypothetical protein